jgi:putative SOS response-associated peptidase YedK
MCGRVAQTVQAISAALESFGVAPAEQTHNSTGEDDDVSQADNNNYNMSPGMSATVLFGKAGEIQAAPKVWGLVPKGGSPASPLPEGMSLHFSNLMFNARSDTLYQKPTFARLANAKKTCLVAVDGYYEWKEQGKGNKQPYFVYPEKNKPYLLLAGLWTSVSTGRVEAPVLETFTILTTEACKSIEWLHTR